jgi:hypothetical protein
MFGGSDVVGASSPDLVRRMLASNYLLVFPEALSVLRAFAPPGSTKANARRQADRFRFCRKLNDTNVSFCINELEVLGAIRPHGDALVATPPPPPSAAAHFVVEAALEITGYKLDTQIPTNLLVQQLIDRMPVAESVVRQGSLHLQLGGPESLLRPELAGAQVRVTRSAFQWMVGQGIIDPLWVGQMLRAEGQRDSAIALGRAIMPKVSSLRPTNIDEYIAVFAEEK